MRIKDLIEKLEKHNPNAYVVIDNKVVFGIEMEYGRAKEGYYNDRWTPNVEKGSKMAVRFTYVEEASDGIVLTRNF